MKAASVENQADSEAGKTARRFRWSKPSPSGLRRFAALAAVVVVIAAFAVVWGLFRGTSQSDEKPGVFTVWRGALTISVTESGDIKAINSVDIKSEVEGRTTIISIVDEGTYITQEDVNSGKILAKLDSSQIEQKFTQQQVTFLSAEASYAEAKESLEIQKKQNESDIKQGQLKVRFAMMDLKKYLGDRMAEVMISKIANPGIEHAGIESFLEGTNNHSSLGGETLQKLRDLDGDIYLKRQELELAKTRLEWTKKLHEKEYIPRNELEADLLDKERRDIALEKANTAKELYVKYEFPKEAEKRLSDYDEAGRELERTEARARSRLAQAEAKLKSNEATYSLQKTLLEKLQKQLAACTIKAPIPGQVVYSSSMMDTWMRRNQPIEVGAQVNELQKIISIPDTSEMKVEVKIHETWVDKIQAGQEAKITVAAFPDRTFTGKVLKKAPLADPEEWLNPDLKVYSADVSIDGTYDFIKTGMSAKAEIIIDHLQDVLSVPLQAVVTQDEQKICYVMTNGTAEKRQVQTGAFNDNFVEITSGLAPGDMVLLSPPRPSGTGEASLKAGPPRVGESEKNREKK